MRSLAALAAGAGLVVAACASGTPAPAPSTASPVPVTSSPLPDGTPFAARSIAFWDAEHGLAVGAGPAGSGVVESTADGGKTWRAVGLGSASFGEVDVSGTGEAWASVLCPATAPASSCHVGLLRSVDGGRTWDAAVGVTLTGLSFGDAAHGWALPVGAQLVGLPTYVLRSDDGGKGWRSVASPCLGTGLEPVAISMADARQAWVGCAGSTTGGNQPKAIMASSDGGASWVVRAWQNPAAASPPASPTRPGGSGAPAAAPRPGPGGLPLAAGLVGLAMRADGTGWLWLSKGALLATADGGRTWKAVAVPGSTISSPIAAAPLGGGRGYVLLRDPKTGGTTLLAVAAPGAAWRQVRAWTAPTS